MKILKSRGGFTLVEILVAQTLIGLLALVFFGLFGFGLQTITRSGQNSEAEFNTQAKLEQRLSGEVVPSASLTEVNGTISLYQSGALLASIPGKIIKATYPFNASTQTAITFIPD